MQISQKGYELFHKLQILIPNEEKKHIELNNQVNEQYLNILQLEFEMQKQIASQIKEDILTMTTLITITNKCDFSDDELCIYTKQLSSLEADTQKISNKTFMQEQFIQCIQDWELTQDQRQSCQKKSRSLQESYQQKLYQKEWIKDEIKKWMQDLCQYKWFQVLFQNIISIDLNRVMSQDIKHDANQTNIILIDVYVTMQKYLLKTLILLQELILEQKFNNLHIQQYELIQSSPLYSNFCEYEERIQILYQLTLTFCQSEQIQSLYRKPLINLFTDIFTDTFITMYTNIFINTNTGAFNNTLFNDTLFDIWNNDMIKTTNMSHIINNINRIIKYLHYRAHVMSWHQKLIKRERECSRTNVWFRTIFEEKYDKNFFLLAKSISSRCLGRRSNPQG